jgi:hypothetical protein
MQTQTFRAGSKRWYAVTQHEVVIRDDSDDHKSMQDAASGSWVILCMRVTSLDSNVCFNYAMSIQLDW